MGHPERCRICVLLLCPNPPRRVRTTRYFGSIAPARDIAAVYRALAGRERSSPHASKSALPVLPNHELQFRISIGCGTYTEYGGGCLPSTMPPSSIIEDEVTLSKQRRWSPVCRVLVMKRAQKTERLRGRTGISIES